MSTKKITIEDIAREANVGIGTVSRVLNNSIHVSDATRKRVLEVVQKLQYTPSGAATKLARRVEQETIVGLLLPDIGNRYFFEIFETIYREFRKQGIDIIIFNYEKHNPLVIQRILDAQLSALLIFAFQLDKTEKLLLRQRNIRYIYIDLHSEDDHCMYTNNEKGGELAAKYLLSKGSKTPCYVSVEPSSLVNEQRLKGFTKVLHQNNITEIPIYTSQLDEHVAYEVGKMIVSEKRCDGVFCYCDEIATGVASAIRESGSSMRLIGFDGLRQMKYVGLSTVSQTPKTIGVRAVEQTVKLIEELPSHITQIEIDPILVDRDS
ncbi:MAG: LacI family DNA-binding transcriptional regulator [Sphaerochaetaceae bacterium]|jgi:DNA-binding LacI/PurR family transcriptional regulator